VLDGSGSEVAIDYSIDLSITNKPTNLKFYTDASYNSEIVCTDGKMNVQGTIALADVGTPLTRTIYWVWPYETGTTANEIEKNDQIDVSDSGKTITMSITVTGTQRNPSDTKYAKLVDLVQVGDYVNYDASSGNGAGKSYTTESDLTGSSTTSTFSSSDSMKWRVLSIDKASGTVKLMSVDPTAQTVTLYGKEGYKNAETVLNKVGAVYGSGNGATGGRSITLEDVEQYSSYDHSTFTNSSGYKYGSTQAYTSGTFVVEDGSEVTATAESPVTMTQTGYWYTAKSYFKNKTAYNMIFKKSTNISANKPTFWLASRCVYLYSSYCNFDVRRVNSGSVSSNCLFSLSGNTYRLAYAVSAVVSLKSNIQTTGQDSSGAWNLVIE
jgi:hypothetical protein